MQITVSVGDNLASIDTGDDTHPTIDEVETLTRVCLEYVLRAHSCITALYSSDDDG